MAGGEADLAIAMLAKDSLSLPNIG